MPGANCTMSSPKETASASTCSESNKSEIFSSSDFCTSLGFLICNNVLIHVGVNSLVDTHPELAMEFSPNEVRNPNEFTKDMAYSILWRCPVCQGDYSCSIQDREIGDSSCPYCSNRRRLGGFNTLEVTNEELAAEWSPNNIRPITDFFETDVYFAYWICPECLGEYKCRICDRKVGDNKCPYCNGIKVLENYNSLYVKHNDLMEEWDYKNNYLICNPNKISDKSNTHVWWICPDCKNTYSLQVKVRVYYKKRKRKPCPYCKGLRQKKRYFL